LFNPRLHSDVASITQEALRGDYSRKAHFRTATQNFSTTGKQLNLREASRHDRIAKRYWFHLTEAAKRLRDNFVNRVEHGGVVLASELPADFEGGDCPHNKCP